MLSPLCLNSGPRKFLKPSSSKSKNLFNRLWEHHIPARSQLDRFRSFCFTKLALSISGEKIIRIPSLIPANRKAFVICCGVSQVRKLREAVVRAADAEAEARELLAAKQVTRCTWQVLINVVCSFITINATGGSQGSQNLPKSAKISRNHNVEIRGCQFCL